MPQEQVVFSDDPETSARSFEWGSNLPGMCCRGSFCTLAGSGTRTPSRRSASASLTQRLRPDEPEARFYVARFQRSSCNRRPHVTKRATVARRTRSVAMPFRICRDGRGLRKGNCDDTARSIRACDRKRKVCSTAELRRLLDGGIRTPGSMIRLLRPGCYATWIGRVPARVPLTAWRLPVRGRHGDGWR